MCLRVFHCLSRIPVQRPGAGGGGGPRPGSTAAVPRAGGRQLLLPASLRPADVYHAFAVQQENSHQRQGQRNRRGQGCLPVSVFFSYILSFTGTLTHSVKGFDFYGVIHTCKGSICCWCISMLVGYIRSLQSTFIMQK